ncbi:hypothetical protein Back11_32440 [Paenibacillus baekrokdamisoli]|uniref:Uncharacterized protein n=1 Tax=Paenibacillus baekrokdamisoli TaxID=1712516 RepID=A0A3G9JG06_9BACL|nr:DUF1003 domain-containing protein [Paenibacillus baekrokdamisoli]MBB3071590.1 putative membrane protein [Paenibacillus baekrokdamisoli]BBH21899.1 hypothetical protein Back11_32440 [Paenibacillus baekrokdamisoli]
MKKDKEQGRSTVDVDVVDVVDVDVEISIIDTLDEDELQVDEQNEETMKRVEKLIHDYKGNIKSRLSLEQKKKNTWPDLLADKIASFGGSWHFIIIFFCILAFWVIWNCIPGLPRFDAPPFILLNLVLSFLAGFQAPIILMSQNRQAARDKHESMIDFAINYQAEQENVEMQQQLNRIETMLQELLQKKADPS